MTKLPEPIHQRLRDEFALAAAKVAGSRTVAAKNYYFSAFFGETARLLNVYWDSDLAFVWAVTQTVSNGIGTRAAQAAGEFPLGGFPDEYLQALDEISAEIAASFEKSEIDSTRLYAALARASALAFVTTGNGAYLFEKGFAKL